MLMRATILYVLFVFASLATAVAVWQSGEVKWGNARLAESAKSEDLLRHDLQAAQDASRVASRRARLAEQALQELTQSRSAGLQELETVTAKLAAARQQASVAETAMTETEDRLAAEIAAHANLKAETAAALDRVKSAAVVSTASVNPTPTGLPLDPANLNASNATVGHIVTPDVPAVTAPAATIPAAAAPAADHNVQLTKPEVSASTGAQTVSPRPETPSAANAGRIEKKKSADSNSFKKKVKPKTFAKRPPTKKTATGSASADLPF
jgi:hypothetical protein